MKRTIIISTIVLLVLAALACNFASGIAPTPLPGTITAKAATVSARLDESATMQAILSSGLTQTAAAIRFTPTSFPPTPAPTLTPAVPNAPLESILVLSPGPNSQIASPVTLSGISNSAFEQRLSIQILDEGGGVILSDGVTITAGLGERGPFEVTLEFTPPTQPQAGRIVVFDLSPRDGHIRHLASVPVTLLPSGASPDIKPAREHPEDIAILSPAPGETIGGGVARVSGLAAPFFEQTLSISVVDASGAVVGSGTAAIQAEAGQPGRFEGEVSYSVSEEQPGSIQVYVVSPRDGGMIHLSSVEVMLRP